jgi:arabinose-5-phosphate isomerase
MSQNPLFISSNTSASKALSIMNQKKITSLCVTSEKNINNNQKKLIGIVHIHNLLNYGLK